MSFCIRTMVNGLIDDIRVRHLMWVDMVAVNSKCMFILSSMAVFLMARPQLLVPTVSNYAVASPQGSG